MNNNYTPKLTLKQKLQHHKYAKLERELKPLCSWVDFYDYLWSYGSINWKGKVVLDIGADIGSKEILGYRNGIAALNREIQNYEVQKSICEALNLQDKIPILEQNIKNAQEYKAKLEDMLNKAVK